MPTDLQEAQAVWLAVRTGAQEVDWSRLSLPMARLDPVAVRALMTSTPDFRPEAYAIDFGTSNTLASAASRTAVHPAIDLDPRAKDPTILRSILHFSKAGPCHLGVEALRQYVAEDMEGRLLRSLKRFLPIPGVTRTLIGGRKYELEDLIARILRSVRERANAYFQADVRTVVLGRPALYSANPEEDDLAEARMRTAAQRAGFEQIQFCAEPVAAARDFQSKLDDTRLIVIADFGGGTSDFSVLKMGPEPFRAQDVLAVGGLSVAGDALDGAMMRGCLSTWFGSEVEYQVPMGRNVLTMPRPVMEMLCSPADLSLLQGRTMQNFLRDIRGWAISQEDRDAMNRLLCLVEDSLGFEIFERIEATKQGLSSSDEAKFEFDYPEIEIEQLVSRSEFEAVCQPQIDAILAALDATLLRAGVQPGQVDIVCVTGGTARVPKVLNALKTRFAEDRFVSHRGLHAVSEGLAHQARQWLQEA